jgi:hypothetical protein
MSFEWDVETNGGHTGCFCEVFIDERNGGVVEKSRPVCRYFVCPKAVDHRKGVVKDDMELGADKPSRSAED